MLFRVEMVTNHRPKHKTRIFELCYIVRPDGNQPRIGAKKDVRGNCYAAASAMRYLSNDRLGPQFRKCHDQANTGDKMTTIHACFHSDV